MAYSFQVPRQRTKPLTQGAQLAEDQNTQGLRTGNFGDVQSARGATDRANALRTSQALQATRGTFARSGVDTSPEAAARAQDQSFSAAEGQNLNGTNAVNQLQRQYRNDAVANANQYEAAANQRQQQGVSEDQFNRSFGANREDAATARQQFGMNYSAGREDANTARNQFGETMAQRKNEFGVSSGQSQQQIDNQSKQFLQSQAQRDKEFGVTSGQSQQQIDAQRSQFDRNLNLNQYQFDKTFGAGREDAADSRSRFDLTRGDTNRQFDRTLGQRQSEFGVTSSQNQQQIDNQAAQAAQRLGYDYASLSQNDKQFFQKMAQDDSQFGRTLGQRQNEFAVTSDQDRQRIENQSNQFTKTFDASREDADTARNQFDLTRGDRNSQFDQTFGANREDAATAKSQFDLTRGDRKTETTMSEINAIQDPVARNLALKAYYEGGDVRAAIGGNIGADGQLINKSMSPGAAAYQAKVDELQAIYPNKSPAEIQQMVQQRSEQADKLQTSVVDEGTKTATVSRAKDILATNPGALSTQDKDALVASGDIPNYKLASSVPIGDKANTMKDKQVKIGNDYYTMVKGGKVVTQWGGLGHDNNHKDYAIVQDGQGNTKYVVDGKLTDVEPRSAKKPKMINNYF